MLRVPISTSPACYRARISQVPPCTAVPCVAGGRNQRNLASSSVFGGKRSFSTNYTSTNDFITLLGQRDWVLSGQLTSCPGLNLQVHLHYTAIWQSPSRCPAECRLSGTPNPTPWTTTVRLNPCQKPATSSSSEPVLRGRRPPIIVLTWPMVRKSRR